MVSVLKDMKNDDITKCEFFFDNLFTSYKLMESCQTIGTGTKKENTINAANQIIESKNALKMTERGTYNFYCAESIYLTSWNDNSECQFSYYCQQVEPKGKVQ